MSPIASGQRMTYTSCILCYAHSFITNRQPGFNLAAILFSRCARVQQFISHICNMYNESGQDGIYAPTHDFGLQQIFCIYALYRKHLLESKVIQKSVWVHKYLRDLFYCSSSTTATDTIHTFTNSTDGYECFFLHPSPLSMRIITSSTKE